MSTPLFAADKDLSFVGRIGQIRRLEAIEVSSTLEIGIIQTDDKAQDIN